MLDVSQLSTALLCFLAHRQGPHALLQDLGGKTLLLARLLVFLMRMTADIHSRYPCRQARYGRRRGSQWFDIDNSDNGFPLENLPDLVNVPILGRGYRRRRRCRWSMWRGSMAAERIPERAAQLLEKSLSCQYGKRSVLFSLFAILLLLPKPFDITVGCALESEVGRARRCR